MADQDPNQDPVVVAVAHPNGEVHNIAVPPDTPLSDFHEALTKAGYTAPDPSPAMNAAAPDFDMPTDPSGKNYTAPGPHAPLSVNEQPSRAGVLENDPKFKAAAKAIWEKAGQGRDQNETGNYIQPDLSSGEVQVSKQDGKATIRVPRSAIALIHTHPAWGGGQPSGPDIDSAKAFGKNIYVVSKSGLQVADKFGNVTNVYNDPNWMNKDNK